MENKSLYYEGHLFVAALRILEHQNSSPPELAQVSAMLRLSVEQTGLICRRLHESGIVELVQGAFGDRWTVADHTQLEALPKQEEVSQLDTALKKFQAERNKIAEKVESIKEQQAQKKKDLFANIEKKLKSDLKKE
ncbi:MAG: hypothetical protein HKP58_01435 [Desulfatitalea sp.]|nr:hypothetical protein [Desulfatitalea sp.]NNJ99049.1 hypothetical protein [Desulfatitalea sp.]